MIMQNDFEKTLKKYAKPQLLTAEKTAKQGLMIAIIVYLFLFVVNFSQYLRGNIEILAEIFTNPLVPAFIIFILYTAIVGSIRSYKIQRTQILEDDPPAAKIVDTSASKAGEVAVMLTEINTLKRTVETLAIEAALLRQKIKSLKASLAERGETKK